MRRDRASEVLHIWCSTFEVFSLVSAMRPLRELIFFAQRTQSGIALSQSLQTLRTALRSLRALIFFTQRTQRLFR